MGVGMMKLAVPAAEQAWACTTAPPAASPAPYYEAPLHSLSPETSFASKVWNIGSMPSS